MVLILLFQIQKTIYCLTVFQVNADGNIFIPNLGEIKVINKTLIEARELIVEKLIVEADLIEPTVDVKLLNNHFTILGEVKFPEDMNMLKIILIFLRP